MYREFTICIICIFSILLLSLSVLSQQEKIMPPVTQVEIKNNIFRDAEQNYNITNNEIQILESQMSAAKQSGNIESVLRLQRQLDGLTGSVTMKVEKLEQRIIEKKNSRSVQDYINTGLVSEVTEVAGISTCTEQTGITAGRIWSSFVFGPGTGAIHHDLRLCYSDDGGRSWNEKITLAFSAGNTMGKDQIDMELLENTNGDKYIWIAFGYAVNYSTIVSRIGIDIVKVSGTTEYTGFTLSWPGTNENTYYRRPRITSDNEVYKQNPWIYIACCLDSSSGGGFRSGSKVAICYLPYTMSPLITYKPSSFNGLYFNFESFYKFHCDIAYYRNGGADSIFFVESSLTDSFSIQIAKSSIFSYVSSATWLGTLNTSLNRRDGAYIASNGGYNRLMIINRRRYSEFDWDIEYFLSENGSSGWTTGYVDYTTYNSFGADIQGFRSAPGVFSCAYYEYNTSFMRVIYCSSANYIWGSPVYQINHISTNQYSPSPRPGVRYGPEGESCLALWSESNGVNIWSSVGCSGVPNPWKNIYFRGVIEAMWYAPADTLRADTLRLFLRAASPPYNIVDSSKLKLDNDGYGTFWFTNAQSYTNYYIAERHRNSIETWSATTFQYSPTQVSYPYDFTFSPLQAYGANEVQVDVLPDLFAFYSGDVDQNGAVNLTDIIIVYNDANNFVSGYVSSDVNNDNATNLTDLLITSNNFSKFVVKITP